MGQEDLERNKRLVREHFEEFVNRKNSVVIMQNMTPRFLDHDGPGGQPTNVAGDKAMMDAIYSKYPDIHVDILDILAEGDKVMCRNRWQGTDSQTGQAIEFHGFVLWRLENGKIAERWATVTAPGPIPSTNPS